MITSTYKVFSPNALGMCSLQEWAKVNVTKLACRRKPLKVKAKKKTKNNSCKAYLTKLKFYHPHKNYVQIRTKNK